MFACRRSDELCAVGCVDWVTGHAEEKRDDLILTLERPQLRGEPPQAAAASVGGAKHCKLSVLGLPGVLSLNLKSRVTLALFSVVPQAMFFERSEIKALEG